MIRLLVIGTVNMDCLFEADQLPRAGRTLAGRRFQRCPGGKAADQAVAAQRLGAHVSLVGCVGDDPDGRALRTHLEREGLDLEHLARTDKAATGSAAVFVCNGESAVTVVPGANQHLDAAAVRAAEPHFSACDLVLAELGVPMSAVVQAADLAARYGKPLLLTLSPAMRLSPSLCDQVGLFLLNEHELLDTFGDGQGDDDWKRLLARWPGRMVLTRGAAGASYVDGVGRLHEQPAFRVPDMVDSTGAGDAFAGALAVFWGLGLPAALRPACAAAALAVRGFGSQTAMPTRTQLDDFLRANVP